MFSVKNLSLINDNIAEFYKVSNVEKLGNVAIYFKENNAYKIGAIVQLLWPHEDSSVIFGAMQNYKYEDYLKCYKKLLPIFQFTSDTFKTLIENGCNKLKIEWLGKNINKYLELSSNSNDNNETKIVENILVLTSLLENGLVNVYFSRTHGKHAPHLLRDLLNTQEIQQVFGIEVVLLLKILMGSPNSINIRNIVWHGFPKTSEIPKYYDCVLLIIIHSLGSIIDSNNFQIKERPQIENFLEHILVFREILKTEVPDSNTILTYINEINNDFAHDYKPYWHQLLSYYRSNRYIEFVILILPQIELLLRLHYGHINNFNVSAKLDEYYITIDTIFEPIVANSKEHHKTANKLLDFEISPFEGCFHLLYDIFISPNGCRLRDKVSHGETCLEALNNFELCSLSLHIFLNLLFPNQFKTLQNYESKLHLNCITKNQIYETQEKLQNFILKHIENSAEHPFLSITFTSEKVLIFQRPKKESEFMLLMKRTLENINKTLNNYEEAISMRSSLMIQRELHSKRRRTLEKLQLSLPEIFKTLHLICTSIGKIYQLLQQNFVLVLEEHAKCVKTIRFLKHSLTISENFIKYSHYESNEWIKSLDLCRKFQELHNKHFLFTQSKPLKVNTRSKSPLSILN